MSIKGAASSQLQMVQLTSAPQLESLLQWQNGFNSLTLADKAQVSADNMIRMTYAMHAIAQTTKLETVSMRIITLVTLIYLPGTFVSVGLCTHFDI